jgi:hypothetical protein
MTRRPSDIPRNFLQKPGLSRFLGGLSVQMTKIALLGGALAVALAPAAMAQNYMMTTPIAPDVATPNHLDSSIGPLDLEGRSPIPATVEKIYDNLDRSGATGLSARYCHRQPGWNARHAAQVRTGQPDV